MNELNVSDIEQVNGGVVFLIPPAVGGALKVAGFAGAAIGGIGAGSWATSRLIGLVKRF
ncbi:hypothetical protein AADZ84_17120 [Colwelliaceae bacterium MEBiC 14330]